ncbi:MAG: alpha/beta hydrolase [Deltaproteobacteria bacterium]|nr:alpha/beta hydrolase [Deltaproteobacteria bacterium]
MKSLFALVFVLAACIKPNCPAPIGVVRVATIATLGESFTIDSKILGERRTINVYLPPDYAKGDKFPVLYMPDGGIKEDFPHVAGAVDVSIKNAVIRPLLVVGIENTERRRDLAPVTTVAEEQKAAPKAGGTQNFRAFLRDELKPAIAKRYRVTEESGIIGESLAGLFVVETLVDEPALFDHYIAADPSVWWNEQDLVRHAHPKLAWWTAGAKTLYIANSSEGDARGIAMLTTALETYAPPVRWTHEPMPDEHHSTIYPRAALRGIRRLFAVPD